MVSLLLLAALAPPPAPSSAQEASAAPITVIYPAEGEILPVGTSTYILGSVSRPKAAFRINSKTVKPHALGGWLDYLPVAPGTFTFHCELELPGGTSAYYDRTVFVPPPPIPLPPGTALIDPDSLQPAEDVELRPGDWLTVQMKASPGARAEFQLGGHQRRLPMVETNAALGIYQGAYQAQPGEAIEAAAVSFHLNSAAGTAADATAKGRVTARPGPLQVVTIVSPAAAVKTAPGAGHLLFPPSGTRMLMAGRQGTDAKIQLSQTLSGWLPAAALQLAPPGTPPPRAVLDTITTAPGPDSSVVTLGLYDAVPYQLDLSDDLSTLTVRLFHTTSHMQWIVHHSTDDFIGHIRWRQEESDVVAVSIRLRPDRRLWGWKASWKGDVLRIELRHPPRLAAKGPVLKGRTVVIDAGHMPSAPGAPGPRGTLEKDVNLAISKELEALLSKEGAEVVMTRPGDDEVTLADRPSIAWEKRGDVFLSVHNNMVNETANPFKNPYGFSVFYYQPISYELAKAVHRAYLRLVPLPDEKLRYGNLRVLRVTEMPAVLTESAYMTFPEQEALLNQPAFRRKLARAMLDGLKAFFDAERGRQGRMKR